VTVSYFEWLKNLNHIHFGRMSRRMEERGKRVLIDALENEFGNGQRFSDEVRSQVVKGYVTLASQFPPLRSEK
jgi:glutamate dehydrogenase (NAD(P)+)